MRSIATETKVGIFVVLGILVLTYFTVRVGQITVREVGYRIYTHVESAAGLDKNSPVRIAGVEVGKVEQVSLDGLKAKVTIHLPFKVKLPEGSKVFVKSAGLLGEKYIEIVPGSGPQVIPAGGSIEEGGPSTDVDRVLAQLSSIGDDIKKVTKTLGNVLGGEEGQRTVKQLIEGARETALHLESITQSIDRGQGTIGKLVKDDKLYVELKNTVASLNQLTRSIDRGEGTLGKLVKDETLYRETKETMASLNRIAQSIDRGEGTLGKLVKDETLYRETKETMASLNQIAQSIERGEGTLGKLAKDDSLFIETRETMKEAKVTMANLSKVSQQIEKGEGTLGKLVKDESLYDDTKRAVKSITKAAEGIEETTPVTVLGVVLGAVIAR
jgi:phospholipid/cholesterol/gamma-HCH transport system substrate-binding protein